MCAKETCGYKNNIAVHGVLAALHLGHVHAASFLVLRPGKLHALGSLYVAIFILNEFLHGGVVNSWVLTIHRNSFALTVVCFADFWPLWPWVVFRPLIWKFAHHLQLDNICCAFTNCSAHTVISCVAAANYKDIFALAVYVLLVVEVAVHKALGGGL